MTGSKNDSHRYRFPQFKKDEAWMKRLESFHERVDSLFKKLKRFTEVDFLKRFSDCDCLKFGYTSLDNLFRIRGCVPDGNYYSYNERTALQMKARIVAAKLGTFKHFDFCYRFKLLFVASFVDTKKGGFDSVTSLLNSIPDILQIDEKKFEVRVGVDLLSKWRTEAVTNPTAPKPVPQPGTVTSTRETEGGISRSEKEEKKKKLYALFMKEAIHFARRLGRFTQFEFSFKWKHNHKEFRNLHPKVFGFKNLEDLLKSIPGVRSVHRTREQMKFYFYEPDFQQEGEEVEDEDDDEEEEVEYEVSGKDEEENEEYPTEEELVKQYEAVSKVAKTMKNPFTEDQLHDALAKYYNVEKKTLFRATDRKVPLFLEIIPEIKYIHGGKYEYHSVGENGEKTVDSEEDEDSEESSSDSDGGEMDEKKKGKVPNQKPRPLVHNDIIELGSSSEDDDEATLEKKTAEKKEKKDSAGSSKTTAKYLRGDLKKGDEYSDSDDSEDSSSDDGARNMKQNPTKALTNEKTKKVKMTASSSKTPAKSQNGGSKKKDESSDSDDSEDDSSSSDDDVQKNKKQEPKKVVETTNKKKEAAAIKDYSSKTSAKGPSGGSKKKEESSDSDDSEDGESSSSDDDAQNMKQKPTKVVTNERTKKVDMTASSSKAPANLQNGGSKKKEESSDSDDSEDDSSSSDDDVQKNKKQESKKVVGTTNKKKEAVAIKDSSSKTPAKGPSGGSKKKEESSDSDDSEDGESSSSDDDVHKNVKQEPVKAVKKRSRGRGPPVYINLESSDDEEGPAAKKAKGEQNVAGEPRPRQEAAQVQKPIAGIARLLPPVASHSNQDGFNNMSSSFTHLPATGIPLQMAPPMFPPGPIPNDQLLQIAGQLQHILMQQGIPGGPVPYMMPGQHLPLFPPFVPSLQNSSPGSTGNTAAQNSIPPVDPVVNVKKEETISSDNPPNFLPSGRVIQAPNADIHNFWSPQMPYGVPQMPPPMFHTGFPGGYGGPGLPGFGLPPQVPQMTALPTHQLPNNIMDFLCQYMGPALPTALQNGANPLDLAKKLLEDAYGNHQQPSPQQ